MRARLILRTSAWLVAGLLAAAPAAAQQPAAPVSPAADPADVATIDATMKAVYDVISGGAGEPRDWDRMRSLFAPGARLIGVSGAARQDGRHLRALTVDDYIKASEPFFLSNGFFEVEVARRTESFGAVFHAFSTYESRRRPDDPRPFARGINSLQLLKDANRWWIVTIFWDSEREGNPIPARYLESAGR